MALVEEKGHVYGKEDYTQDGTVDLKGRPVLRSKTGRWRACTFIVVYEIFERLAYQAIAANLVIYLTRELHQGTVKASNSVTNWSGTIWMTPILGAYIADANLGRFWTFIAGSAIYLMGMILLTLVVSLPALRAPSCSNQGVKGDDCPKASSFQLGMFYLALYIIAVGNGGTKPNISTLGAEQFDEFEPKEKSQKLSFFNWWVFSIFIGFLISETIVVYIQDNVGWTLGYGLPTAGLGISILVFLAGIRFYRHKVPSGSPFTKMTKVIFAAFRKWKLPLPNDAKELYELNEEGYTKSGLNRIDHTPSLRFLDKAALKSGIGKTPWTLSPVTQVEETKQIVKLLPFLLATFMPSILIAQTNTLFIKQGTTLDRSIGPNFDLPPASLERFGIGLVLHVIISITACLAERKRLSVARENGVFGKKEIVPLTVFILLPQFALTGIADAFLEVARQEFFYDQAPEGMKSLGASFYTTSRGVGNFLSSILLTMVSDITKRHGHKGWILDNLNVSHLDYYYAFLAVLALLNLLFFMLVAKSFVYNVEVEIQECGFSP
ncbi:Proton-dependent oligopeptide transporter [Trema orientale]|uniref:Proton-dependent oligopeptide transporter n=1 Tax=Trema orientale TaxID=63057 RepID=A0A2P5D0Q4_TREOI|nr:Proton-dependent oligopeptide transporter [Trema orientale]